MARSAWKTVKLTRAQTAIGAAGLAGLIVTLVLSLVAVRESRRSTEIAERALVAGHRAFVFASGINPQWEINAITSEYNWRIRPIWQNSGETPTRRLRLVADCVIRDTELPLDFRFPERDPGTGLLGPKASSSGGPGPLPPSPAITPADIVEAQNGRRFIYLWGWVRYFDVFPDTSEHVTRFCWLILSGGDPYAFAPGEPLTHPHLHFAYLHWGGGHNWADEECEGV